MACFACAVVRLCYEEATVATRMLNDFMHEYVEAVGAAQPHTANGTATAHVSQNASAIALLNATIDANEIDYHTHVKCTVLLSFVIRSNAAPHTVANVRVESQHKRSVCHSVAARQSNVRLAAPRHARRRGAVLQSRCEPCNQCSSCRRSPRLAHSTMEKGGTNF